MKKIYTLIALLGCCTAANAQRLVDLQVTLTSPVTGNTITSAQSTNINGVIRNVGTTVLKATDTVLMGYFIDGTQVGSTYFKTNRLMNPNDTFQFNNGVTLTFPAASNGAHSLCLVAVPTNRTADSVRDNVTANNQGCANLTFAGGSTSVQTISVSLTGNAVVNTYPMPAHSEVSFDLNLGSNSQVAVRIMDLAGRVVLSENRGMMAKGAQTIRLSTASLGVGLYLYQVIMDGAVSGGKLVISR